GLNVHPCTFLCFTPRLGRGPGGHATSGHRHPHPGQTSPTLAIPRPWPASWQQNVLPQILLCSALRAVVHCNSRSIGNSASNCSSTSLVEGAGVVGLGVPTDGTVNPVPAGRAVSLLIGLPVSGSN